MKNAILWGMGLALALGILLLLFAKPAAAETSARVVSVYDGDSITVEADIWPGLVWRGSVRVDGVDTPEIRGGCDEEKRRARQARDFVMGELGLFGPTVVPAISPTPPYEPPPITLHDVRRGKYAGRVVARVILGDGTDLADALITAGLGRPYDGGARDGWC